MALPPPPLIGCLVVWLIYLRSYIYIKRPGYDAWRAKHRRPRNMPNEVAVLQTLKRTQPEWKRRLVRAVVIVLVLATMAGAVERAWNAVNLLLSMLCLLFIRLPLKVFRGLWNLFQTTGGYRKTSLYATVIVTAALLTPWLTQWLTIPLHLSTMRNDALTVALNLQDTLSDRLASILGASTDNDVPSSLDDISDFDGFSLYSAQQLLLHSKATLISTSSAAESATITGPSPAFRNHITSSPSQDDPQSLYASYEVEQSLQLASSSTTSVLIIAEQFTEWLSLIMNTLPRNFADAGVAGTLDLQLQMILDSIESQSEWQETFEREIRKALAHTEVRIQTIQHSLSEWEWMGLYRLTWYQSSTVDALRADLVRLSDVKRSLNSALVLVTEKVNGSLDRLRSEVAMFSRLSRGQGLTLRHLIPVAASRMQRLIRGDLGASVSIQPPPNQNAKTPSSA